MLCGSKQFILEALKKKPEQRCQCENYSCYALYIRGGKGNYWSLAIWSHEKQKVEHKLMEA